MTDAFYQQAPNTRLRFPNEAEQMFDKMTPRSAPWGISHPPVDINALPGFVRFAPDRLMGGRFVECKGVGKDGIIKIKIEQLYALQHWSTIMPVYLFIWDSYRKRYCLVEVDAFMKACEKHAVLEQFPDNHKPAWFMSIDFLPVKWEDYDDAS